jgi:hypothetical protein
MKWRAQAGNTTYSNFALARLCELGLARQSVTVPIRLGERELQYLVGS